MRHAALVVAVGACRVEVGDPAGPAERCDDDAPAGEVWIYTSLYPHVAEALEAALRAAHPGLEPQVFQAGSEKVAQRVEAEWAAGSSPACVLLTSDPFWYVRLAEEGKLRPHLSPNVLKVDRGLVDEEGAWTAVRRSLVVLGVRDDLELRPASFADLAAPAFRDRITAGDPLASGTMLTWVASLAAQEGWGLLEAIEANGLVAAGGGSAVRERVDSGEKPVGVLLLENLLAAESTRAAPVFPSDGAVVVPGPVAIPTTCPNPAAAEAVVDFLLSPPGQAVLVAGDLYGVLPGTPPPDGAPALDTIPVRPWAPGFAARAAAAAADTKARWAELVSR
jgi:iron(III) transport system substrate-binding protein